MSDSTGVITAKLLAEKDNPSADVILLYRLIVVVGDVFFAQIAHLD